MRIKLLTSTLLVLAGAAAFAQIENTLDFGVLTPDIDSTFDLSGSKWGTLFHLTNGSGSYALVRGKVWIPTSTNVTMVTGDFGVKTGGFNSAWLAADPSWQQTVTGRSLAFSNVIAFSSGYELRVFEGDASGLDFSAGESGFGVRFSLPTVIWATTNPNEVPPNFITDGIAGPNGFQSEDYMSASLAVPEPGTYAALGLGFFGLLRHHRRR